MNAADLLVDAFGRVNEAVHQVVGGLNPDQLGERVGGEANPIVWLVWHLTRVQDDHLADAAGTEQVWLTDGWADRFALPFDRSATGYGQSGDEVASVRVDSAELLTGYHDAVHERTLNFVSALADDDLDRVVDTSWDPPVTLGVRLVSVVNDVTQHIGQAAFVRGVVA